MKRRRLNSPPLGGRPTIPFGLRATLEEVQREFERVRERTLEVEGRAMRNRRLLAGAQPGDGRTSEAVHGQDEAAMQDHQEPPRLVVTTADDLDALSRATADTPPCSSSATRTVLANSLEVFASLEDRLDGWVMVVAPRDTPLQEQIARLCFHA